MPTASARSIDKRGTPATPTKTHDKQEQEGRSPTSGKSWRIRQQRPSTDVAGGERADGKVRRVGASGSTPDRRLNKEDVNMGEDDASDVSPPAEESKNGIEDMDDDDSLSEEVRNTEKEMDLLNDDEEAEVALPSTKEGNLWRKVVGEMGEIRRLQMLQRPLGRGETNAGPFVASARAPVVQEVVELTKLGGAHVAVVVVLVTRGTRRVKQATKMPRHRAAPRNLHYLLLLTLLPQTVAVGMVNDLARGKRRLTGRMWLFMISASDSRAVMIIRSGYSLDLGRF